MADRVTYEEMEQTVNALSRELESSRRREKELQEAESYYRAFFEHGTDGVVVLDHETGRPLDFNDQVCRQLGYSREEFSRLRLPDIEARETAPEIEAHIRKTLKNGFDDFETLQRTKGGEIRHVHVSAQVIDTGSRAVYHCIWRDITERKRVEEELRASESLNRAIVENISQMLFLKDRNSVYLFVNKLYADSLSLKPEDFVGKDDFSFYPDELARKYRADDIQVMESGRVKDIEETFIADGKDYLVRTIKAPVRNAAGEVTSLLGIFEDITRRKRAEAAVRESEEKYRSILDNASAIIFIKDTDGKYVYINKLFERLHGITDEKIHGLTDYDIFPRELADQFRKNDLTVMQSNKPMDMEETVPQEDGVHTVISTKFPLLDTEGKAYAICGIATDITERKQAEEMLRSREQLLNEMGSIARIGGWEHDLITGKATWTPTTYQLAELALGSAVPGLDEHLSYYPPKDRKILEEAYRLSIETGEQFDIEAQAVTMRGRPVWARVVGRPEYAEGNCVKMKGIIQDITEQKKMEGQLLQAQKMESVGRLAGGVAHDFNNMLGIIMGNAEMILDEMDSDHPFIANLQEIYKAAERSANLTRQLLAFARKQTISPKPLNLNETLEAMLKMLKRLIGEDIDLAWLPAENLWPIKIDPSQIDQIFANLCVNARDAIKGVGKVTIETSNASIDEEYCRGHVGALQGDYVMFSVSDNGCGMDKDTQANLFEPFFTTKDIGQGSGLGLATVYGIVKQNNGFINVYSELDKGTTFKIYLPRHMDEKIQGKAQESVVIVSTGHETVLLVEDEKAILRMTKMMLERLGYTVLAASTPSEAIRIAEYQSGEIHLLMTDIVMPDMNGRELAGKLLRLYPNLKILFMSGYTANVIAHHGVLDEGVQFIHKPFTKRDLAAKLREILDEADGAGAD